MSHPYYRWAVVGMLWFVCLFNYADRQAIFSVFDPIKEEMDLSDVQLGVIGSSFMWVYAITLPLAGLVGDRLSRKGLILGGLVFWSLITLATAYAQNYWQLVLFRALEGLGEAFYFPASMSLISDYHRKDTRSRAMAFHQSSVYVGTILGGAVAGYCAQYYGWRSGFQLFGGAGVLLAVVLLFTLKEPERGATDDGPKPPPAEPGDLARGVKEVLATPMVLVFLGVFVGTVFVGSIFLAWMPTYLKRQFGMSLSMAGLNATFWLQTASVVGVVVGGWLADRWMKQTARGRVMVQAIGLFLGAPLIFLAGWTRDVTVLVFVLAGFGFFKGMYDANTWAALYDVVRTPRRSTALGLVNGLGWLMGGATAPVLIAVMAERIGFGPSISAVSLVYVLTGVLLVGGAMLFLPSRPHTPPKADEAEDAGW